MEWTSKYGLSHSVVLRTPTTQTANENAPHRERGHWRVTGVRVVEGEEWVNFKLYQSTGDSKFSVCHLATKLCVTASWLTSVYAMADN
ncbi:unnamed protein product [Ilex paraguariensis]|uniref:Uncharacterized protein n=1 Tax=Ilex paraguariensis TaxID=185542 RepID=A0ABC8UUD1_9AQUA